MMKKKFGILFIIICCVVLIYGIYMSGMRKKDVLNNTEETDILSGEEVKGAEMISELLECNQSQSEKISREFNRATGKAIEKVEMIPTDKKSYLVKAEAEGVAYYLKITSAYMLREIREGAEDGEILYQVIY